MSNKQGKSFFIFASDLYCGSLHEKTFILILYTVFKEGGNTRVVWVWEVQTIECKTGYKDTLNNTGNTGNVL